MGIGSAVNRYVARLRSEGRLQELNRVVSTVNIMQIAIAFAVLIASLVLAYVVPNFYADKFQGSSEPVGLVIGFLGASLAVQTAYDAWRGVITGCHRWDYYHAINSGGYTFAAIGMIVSLFLGGGLEHMSMIYFVTTVGTELVRKKVADRVCPELNISWSQANLPDASKVLRFGVHTSMLKLPSVIIIQTVSILAVANMGVASLALLMRPLALIRQVGLLVSKFAFVLTPMAGSMQGEESESEIKKFAVDSSKVAWRLALAPLVFMFVLGDKVIELWMGPDYADWQVVAVLSAGFVLIAPQRALVHIVIGLNRHDKIARTGLILAVLLLTMSALIASRFDWTVTTAATIISLCLGVGVGSYFLFGCLRALEIGIVDYAKEIFLEILTFSTLLAFGLVVIRQLIGSSAAGSVAVGLAYVGGVVLVLYRKELFRAFRAMW